MFFIFDANIEELYQKPDLLVDVVVLLEDVVEVPDLDAAVQ